MGSWIRGGVGDLGLNQNLVEGHHGSSVFPAPVPLGLSCFVCKMGLMTAVLPTPGGVWGLKVAKQSALTAGRLQGQRVNARPTGTPIGLWGMPRGPGLWAAAGAVFTPLPRIFQR